MKITDTEAIVLMHSDYNPGAGDDSQDDVAMKTTKDKGIYGITVSAQLAAISINRYEISSYFGKKVFSV